MTDAAPEVARRVKVALVSNSADALDRLRFRTGMTSVDLMNRAIQIYEYLDAQQHAGQSVCLMAEDGSIERVTFS